MRHHTALNCPHPGKCLECLEEAHAENEAREKLVLHENGRWYSKTAVYSDMIRQSEPR